MIYLIFGDPGAGKTAFMTAQLIDEMHGERGRERYMQCKRYIDDLNAQGWNLPLPKQRHCVYASYEITYRSPYCGKRTAYDLDPFKLGFGQKNFRRAKLLPYGVIGIDEAQKYFDSHHWQEFPAYKSRFFEQHRKWGLDIYLAVQKDTLIDSNLRLLSKPIRIESLSERTIEGEKRFTWTYTTWEHYRNYAAGEQGKEVGYTFSGNIFEYYDSYEGKQLFLADVEDAQGFDDAPRKTYTMSPLDVKDYIKDNKQSMK
ncbi:MAG: hypothetical protein NC350_05715 [Corallococcus sp.]|nr:hypothetical protein [Corallococcus sp.]